MARKNQKLINYHTGKKAEMPKLNEVDYGEIVVRHNAESPELLIKIGEDSFGVFQASGAVQTAINTAVSAAQSTLNTTISGLQSDVKSLSSATKTLIDEVSAATKATYATKAELKSTSGSIITAYEKAVGDAKIEIYDSATTFATKAKDDAITAAAASATTLLGLVDAVDERVDTVSGDLNTFKTTVASTYATQESVTSAIATAKSEAIDAAAASAETLNTSIEAVDDRVDTVSGDLNTFKTNVANTYATQTGVTSDIATAKSEAISAAAADAQEKANTAKSEAIAAAAASAKTLSDKIDGVDNKVGTLSGNVETAIQNLETGLTATINKKVATAYRYQKTVTNYADLPTSEMSKDTVGYVYNVENANDNYPAGTNYAWNGTEWDALGGSVDLSPYALKTEVSASAETLNNKIETVSASLNTFKTDVANTYETKDNVTTAITAAKNSVYSSATTAAFAEAKSKADAAEAAAIAAAAASADTLNTSIKTVDGRVDTVSASLNTFKTEVANTYETKDNVSTAITAAKESVYSSATTAAFAEAKSKADAAQAAAIAAAAASANTLQNNIDTVNNSVTGLSASTVTIQGVANSAIQTASIVDGDSCKVSVNKEGTELQFDFRNLVVDCGDF